MRKQFEKSENPYDETTTTHTHLNPESNIKKTLQKKSCRMGNLDLITRAESSEYTNASLERVVLNDDP